MKKCVILANGDFPEHPAPLQTLKNADFVICCDGAANEYIQRGGKPNLIIGDLDTLSPENRDSHSNIVSHQSSQEFNDLNKAINWCIQKGVMDFKLLGLTGKRSDHTLGNLGILFQCAFLPKTIRALTNFECITPINSPSLFQSYSGQQVSIIAQDPRTTVSGQGLHWPLQNTLLSSWNAATLNTAQGEDFGIVTESPLLVFQRY